MYLNHVRIPEFFQGSLVDPEGAYGLARATSYVVGSTDGVRLGVWWIPSNGDGGATGAGEMPSSSKLVFLYAHGNAFDRGQRHRVELYQKLRDQFGAHVVAFDYRGYGDSTLAIPTEDGVVDDAEAVYGWIIERHPDARVVLWGHSLGSGVASALAVRLRRGGRPAPLREALRGVVLEAPFRSAVFAATSFHALKYLLAAGPLGREGSYRLVKSAMGEEDNFDTEARIPLVDRPLIMVHGTRDSSIPHYHSEELFQAIPKQGDVADHERLSARALLTTATAAHGHPVRMLIIDSASHNDLHHFEELFESTSRLLLDLPSS